MKQIFCITFFSSVFLSGFTQHYESKMLLPKQLNEISGLEYYNDSILIAINDGGNEPRIYFLDIKGNIKHTVLVANTKNNDWEDLTIDPYGNLFIADCGNNRNDRTNLSIIQLSLKNALEKDSLWAKSLPFHYANQNEFPPPKEQLDFDCESVYWQNDSIYLVTKSRAEPWKGLASIYALPANGKSQLAVKRYEIMIGNDGWWNDAVTAADMVHDTLILLTYQRMLYFTNVSTKFQLLDSYVFKDIDQKESIVCKDVNTCYLASEHHAMTGGPFLYIITK